MVTPKQEVTEEKDTNSEEFDGIQNSSSEVVASDSDSIYDGRSMSTFYQQPVVDRGKQLDLISHIQAVETSKLIFGLEQGYRFRY